MNAIESLINQFDSSCESSLTSFFKKTLLKELRLSKLRRPDIVVKCAPDVIKYQDTNNNDYFTLQEQVFSFNNTQIQLLCNNSHKIAFLWFD